ncbi:hypothetical protein JCM25156A_32340 [Komagataeibacter kakiaceti JCM 25156]|uniref:phage baseplate assembly protein domain-containing protein n=1 Tax=Komagataeibacter kakiaceti TaxID=943261 RepID=UPI00046F6822|nr:phage baseplate assembly protein [Komagataeibacter kakiaceti]
MSGDAHSFDHIVMQLRGLAVRAVVQAIDDTGANQLVTVTAHAGRTRSQVPVHQQFGLSSCAPVKGAVTPVVALGGDPSDLVALPPANPSLARAGGLDEGETVLYDSVGQQIYLQDGKIVRIIAATEMRVEIGGKTLLDITPQGATLNVDLKVNGTIAATGDIKAGDISVQEHLHNGVQVGTGETGAPQS